MQIVTFFSYAVTMDDAGDDSATFYPWTLLLLLFYLILFYFTVFHKIWYLHFVAGFRFD